ncbi:hypothetical protein ACFYRN_19230 [Streptomyces sp. NPDC005227]|uniref:hypothetical protein n=1 Tax=Streptomyces sp. NPDC005227 TaxID=3364707 RepID=UPI0036CF06D9
MTPNPDSPGSVRSADELNDAIRALWIRAAGRTLTPNERSEYERLVAEWAAAIGEAA